MFLLKIYILLIKLRNENLRILKASGLRCFHFRLSISKFVFKRRKLKLLYKCEFVVCLLIKCIAMKLNRYIQCVFFKSDALWDVYRKLSCLLCIWFYSPIYLKLVDLYHRFLLSYIQVYNSLGWICISEVISMLLVWGQPLRTISLSYIRYVMYGRV